MFLYFVRYFNQGCDIPVHQKCYGMQFVPSSDWFCELCIDFKEDGLFMNCVFCGLQGGVLRKTNIAINTTRVEKINNSYYEWHKEQKISTRRGSQRRESGCSNIKIEQNVHKETIYENTKTSRSNKTNTADYLLVKQSDSFKFKIKKNSSESSKNLSDEFFKVHEDVSETEKPFIKTFKDDQAHNSKNKGRNEHSAKNLKVSFPNSEERDSSEKNTANYFTLENGIKCQKKHQTLSMTVAQNCDCSPNESCNHSKIKGVCNFFSPNTQNDPKIDPHQFRKNNLEVTHNLSQPHKNFIKNAIITAQSMIINAQDNENQHVHQNPFCQDFCAQTQTQESTKISNSSNLHTSNVHVATFYNYFTEMNKMYSKNPESLPPKQLTKISSCWAHNSCILNNENLSYVFESKPIRLTNFHHFRTGEKIECSICLQKEGTVVKCKEDNCKKHFHSECARRTNFEISVENGEIDGSNTAIRIVCSWHKSISAQKAIVIERLNRKTVFQNFTVEIKSLKKSLKGYIKDQKLEKEIDEKVIDDDKNPNQIDFNLCVNLLNEQDRYFLQIYKKVLLKKKPNFGFVINLKEENSKFRVDSIRIPKQSIYKISLNSSAFPKRDFVNSFPNKETHLIEKFEKIQKLLSFIHENSELYFKINGNRHKVNKRDVYVDFDLSNGIQKSPLLSSDVFRTSFENPSILNFDQAKYPISVVSSQNALIESDSKKLSFNENEFQTEKVENNTFQPEPKLLESNAGSFNKKDVIKNVKRKKGLKLFRIKKKFRIIRPKFLLEQIEISPTGQIGFRRRKQNNIISKQRRKPARTKEQSSKSPVKQIEQHKLSNFPIQLQIESMATRPFDLIELDDKKVTIGSDKVNFGMVKEKVSNPRKEVVVEPDNESVNENLEYKLHKDDKNEFCENVKQTCANGTYDI